VIPTGPVSVRNWNSGLCLEASNGSLSFGAGVLRWTCHPGIHQRSFIVRQAHRRRRDPAAATCDLLARKRTARPVLDRAACSASAFEPAPICPDRADLYIDAVGFGAHGIFVSSCRGLSSCAPPQPRPVHSSSSAWSGQFWRSAHR
jgi:hypothetical protein